MSHNLKIWQITQLKHKTHILRNVVNKSGPAIKSADCAARSALFLPRDFLWWAVVVSTEISFVSCACSVWESMSLPIVVVGTEFCIGASCALSLFWLIFCGGSSKLVSSLPKGPLSVSIDVMKYTSRSPIGWIGRKLCVKEWPSLSWTVRNTSI